MMDNSEGLDPAKNTTEVALTFNEIAPEHMQTTWPFYCHLATD